MEKRNWKKLRYKIKERVMPTLKVPVIVHLDTITFPRDFQPFGIDILRN